MDKTAIVIVHYLGEKDTYDCLDSIIKNNSKEDLPQIIVVINPTEDENLSDQKLFIDKLQKSFPQIIIIKNKINLGFAGGNNIGIRKALGLGCVYILLLNNDTVVSFGLIDKLVNFMHQNSSAGLVSPKIYFAKGYEYHKERYKENERGKVLWYAGGIIDWDNIYASHRGVDEIDKGQFDIISEKDFATGCCMLLKKDTIKRVGLFDEKYFLYYEDIDLSMRVKKEGMKIMFYPGAYLWHKNASSSGKPGSKLHIYYQTRNRLYFGFKYASLKTKKSLFLDSIKMIGRGGIYAKAVFDYYLGRMGMVDL